MKINIFNKTLEKIKSDNNIDDLKLWFKNSYLYGKDSYRIIAKKLNINERTIKKILLHFDIEIRHGSEAVKSQWVEKRKKYRIKENVYIEYDDYIKILVYGKDVKPNGYFIIDKEDLEKSKKYQWHIDSTGYAKTSIKNNDKYKIISFHRYLIGAENNEFVDHINGERNDNRKNNIRICSMQQNSHNRGISKNNTSGVKGVSKRKNGNWQAGIRFNGTSYYLGTFEKIEDAIKSRKNAEEKYFKEFRRI